MKPAAFEYHPPGTVEEALAALAELGHQGKVLAGGPAQGSDVSGHTAWILNTYHGARQRPARCDVEEER